MKLLDKIQTAQSNLMRAKVRTFLTILAVFIGTFTLAMTTGLTEGVRQYLYVQIHAYGESNSINITSKSKNEQNPTTFTQADVAAIKTIPNMQNVYPDYSTPLDYVMYNKEQFQGGVTSLYPDMTEAIAAGTQPSPTDKNAIILPYDALSQMNVKTPADAIGKTILLHISKTNGKAVTGSETIPLTIKAVLASSIHSQPSFISYELAKDMFIYQHGSVDGFTSFYATTTPNLSSSQLDTLKNTLDQKGYKAMTFQDQISRLNQVIGLAQLGMGGFAGISLLVATICIINTLLMSVLERVQEIGLLKALGMTRKGIFTIFTFEAASIGFWGGVLGVGIAILLSPILNKLVAIKISQLEGFSLLTFPPVFMAIIILGAMAVGLIAGVIPAIRASRLDPITALRRE